MDIPQMGLIGNQVRSAARSKLQRAEAGVIKEASIAQQANRLFSSALRGESPRPEKKAPRKSGVYMKNGDAAATPAPDGYVRKSPVQAIRVAKDYRARIVKRVLAAIIGVIILALLIYALLDLVKF